MSRTERQKGQRGEREVRDILRAVGFTCERDGRLDTDLSHNVTGYHFEVKRRERLALPEWLRQAEDEAALDETPVVVYRASNQPWRAVLPFDRLAYLLALEAGIRVPATEVSPASAPTPLTVDRATRLGPVVVLPGPSASDLARAARMDGPRATEPDRGNVHPLKGRGVE
jgi:hypothetical protein